MTELERSLTLCELEIDALNTLARLYQLKLGGDLEGMEALAPGSTAHLRGRLGGPATFVMEPVASPILSLSDDGGSATAFWQTPGLWCLDGPQGLTSGFQFVTRRATMTRAENRWVFVELAEDAMPDRPLPRPLRLPQGPAAHPVEADVLKFRDTSAIRDLMGALSLFWNAGQYADVLSLFSGGDHMTLEDDRVGVYRGPQAVASYFDALSRSTVCRMLPLCSQLIEIDPDRSRAEGMWYSTGHTGDWWDFSKLAASFVLVDGLWRVETLKLIEEMAAPDGESWADVAARLGSRPAEASFPAPTEPSTTHYPYRVDTTSDLTVWPPAPAPLPGPLADHPLALRARRLVDYLEVCKLMARYSFLHYGGKHEPTYEFFTRRPDVRCELGPVGVYEGPDKVYDFFVAQHAGGDRPGVRRMHPVALPMVEIAGDGKTARGLWLTPGIEGDATDPTWAAWYYDSYANDFIKDPEGWKWWHFHLVEEIHADYGYSFEEWAAMPHMTYEEITAEDEAAGIYHAKATRGPTFFSMYDHTRRPHVQVALPAPYHSWADITPDMEY